MTLLTRDTLKKLILDEGRGKKTFVSIYLPTHRSEPEARQDRIRLRNLLRRAEEYLSGRGKRKTEIDALLDPARARLSDLEFWRYQRDGLVLLFTEDDAHEFRLPVPVEEICVVNDRYHVTPLLRALSGDGSYYVLALSQDDVRLFSATRDEIRELPLRNVPRRLEDALGEQLFKPAIQWHTRTPSQVGGDRRAVFHGHGAGTDDVEPELRRYVQIVDRALLQELADRSAPLVIAAVEKTAALYHHESQHPSLVPEWIEGNPDILDAAELHRRSWPLVQSTFSAREVQALELFGQMEDAGRAATDLQEIMRAAEEGRIGTLFVADGEHRWGEFDGQNRTVEVHDERLPGDEDLVERAAAMSLLGGADVYVKPREDMPRQAPVAALYRFRSESRA